MPEYYSLKDLLVARGVALDLKEATALILSGKVLVDEQKIDKPGTKIKANAVVRIKGISTKYVSRAGEKLEGIVKELDLTRIFDSATVLDVGSSTGGFTDFSLQNGAKEVYAVDVGTNQIHWKLRNDPRVHVYEKTDIKKFERPLHVSFDVIVCDVSFTSITFILESIKVLASPSTYLFMLIKPQFEADRADVESGGLITDESTRTKIIERAIESIKIQDFEIIANRDSTLRGRMGNLESWVVCRPTSR
ncbi:MAG: TlyA family RNA methyltransferase [Pseudomonadota bacterium]